MKRTSTRRFHLPSIFQLLWSSLAASFFGAAALFFLSLGAAEGVFHWLYASSSVAHDKPLPVVTLLVISSGFLWLMLITLPSLYYAIKHLAFSAIEGEETNVGDDSREVQKTDPADRALAADHPIIRLGVILSPLLFAAVLGLGRLCSNQPLCGIILLPAFQILGVSLPIGWFFALGVYRLYSLSRQEFWSVLANSISLSPLVILIMESMVFILFAVFIGVGLSFLLGPDQLTTMMQGLEQAKDREALFQVLRPLLAQPLVVGGILLFISVFVPFLEEAFKPLALWLVILFLWKGNRSLPKCPPCEGFALGLICGGGYALLESLFLVGVTPEWTAIVVSRAAASLLHVVHGGLMGWAAGAAAASFQRSRPWKQRIKGLALLLLAYSWVVLVHGLWNGMTLFAVLAELSSQVNAIAELPLILPLGKIAPVVLGALIIGQLIILLALNGSLRKHMAKALQAGESAAV